MVRKRLLVSKLAMCNQMLMRYKFLDRGWCQCRRVLKKVEKSENGTASLGIYYATTRAG